MAKNATIVIIALLILYLLSSCANQLPPGGGEDDKIPPEIIETYPLPNTTNYDENYFEIEFSEYVDKRSFTDALFISPNIGGRLLFDWTGTGVTVEFENELEKDITYTVTVGTDLVDRNNRNRMSSSFSFAFSTGDKIDRRAISGEVYDSKPEGVLIYAYRLDDGVDTLVSRKPNYVSQTGKDGSFILNGLAEDNYRIFAVKDEYRDLLYTLDQDMIGVPTNDVSLLGIDTIYTGLRFKLFKADTTAPRLLKAIMTDDNHILATLTEFIDSSAVKRTNFFLVDSTEDQKTHISHVFRRYGKNDEIVLITEVKQKVNNTVFLFASNLVDTSSNSFQNDFVQLTISERTDTTPVNIVATIPAKNSNTNFDNPEIKLFFDDAIVKDDIAEAIILTDTLKNSIKFRIKSIDDASIQIIPIDDLRHSTDYILKCDLNVFKDISGNKRDSVYELKFKTISDLDYTGVSGTILNSESIENIVLVLENIQKSNLKYQLPLMGKNFNFEDVDAGRYLLWCYIDSDSSQSFNYGWPQPIEYSERFFIYPDTLKLKPRWVVTDVIFPIVESDN